MTFLEHQHSAVLRLTGEAKQVAVAALREAKEKKRETLRIRELNPGLRRFLRGDRWSSNDKAPS